MAKASKVLETITAKYQETPQERNSNTFLQTGNKMSGLLHLHAHHYLRHNVKDTFLKKRRKKHNLSI